MPFTVSDDKTVRHQVTPIVDQSIVALAVQGPKISRLAPSSRISCPDRYRPGIR